MVRLLNHLAGERDDDTSEPLGSYTEREAAVKASSGRLRRVYRSLGRELPHPKHQNYRGSKRLNSACRNLLFRVRSMNSTSHGCSGFVQMHSAITSFVSAC
jgi:IS1 family transposase